MRSKIDIDVYLRIKKKPFEIISEVEIPGIKCFLFHRVRSQTIFTLKRLDLFFTDSRDKNFQLLNKIILIISRFKYLLNFALRNRC